MEQAEDMAEMQILLAVMIVLFLIAVVTAT